MIRIIFFTIIFFNCISAQNTTIYVVKYSWHTGLFIPVNKETIERIPVLKQFSSYKIVDIGWGDHGFYQSESEFDLELALKALFTPTKSVVRIIGSLQDPEDIKLWSDFFFEFGISDSSFTKFASFINQTMSDSLAQPLSEKAGGIIKFYSSDRNYSLFYTCNTWAAECLGKADIPVTHEGIITAEDLFIELKSCVAE